MKYSKLIFIFLTMSLTACGKSVVDSSEAVKNNPAELEEDFAEGFFDEDFRPEQDDEGFEESHGVLDEEEVLLKKNELAPYYKFAQTLWDECNEDVTGNYSGYGCATRRGISVILKTYLANHIFKCVDAGLSAQGGGNADEIHITHAGIVGDARHSPRSMHAEQRAIDIKSIQIKKTNGQQTQFTYSKSGNRSFYVALRNCWGRTVATYNGCPLYNGSYMYTGSIGWEDRNHGQHMHLSVPYCINGSHGSYFWKR